MKRITLLAVALIAASSDAHQDQPLIGYPGSTLDVDDTTAGLLVVAGKAKYDKDAKAKDTTKEHERAADDRVKAANAPDTRMADAIAGAVTAAVTAALAAQAAQAKAPA